ncbi:LacI family DNA-binding transcriptional regulator [Caballeronia sp. LZ062]|uniref:LacI family DNA-binding transcriptional regulator n=1 Tax=unclassified Caballeronia TaxID=2646786 RepID=UPI00285FE8BB|nr:MULTISPECIES: LacI family DNA-binding transcriptional regulator [unclassified Caballeronia]MDR5854607.1 LacI family DNA-binding transcriptional regulator [Caballeronia sp. LZ050]MDR5870865.1 LacI family DNA-binding transcriptional regulator [Caballeronia sp. LZ062]
MSDDPNKQTLRPLTFAARRATITDVAREAGTGKTSISRYLNGETGVLSPELRERIEAAIAKLDYRPNQMARGLKRGRNRLIGMLLADLTNPYSVEVLQGVEAACHALGYMPLICHAANEVDMERRYLQLLTTYRVEGVIVNALGVKEELLQGFTQGGIPVVLVDRTVEGIVTDMVGLDNPAAVALATRHLVDEGFDELVFIVQPVTHVSSRRLREAAFRETVAALDTNGSTLVLDLADAASALAEMDRRVEAARVSGKRVALFAANGPVALRVAVHLKERHGPDWQASVALLAIDDSEWAELAGMTAVRQPTYDIGRRAVEFLHERLGGALMPARECLLPGELVVRSSTQCSAGIRPQPASHGL